MSSHYNITYHLRTHKRDPFIEFIKGLLLSPFVTVCEPDREVKLLEAFGSVLERIEGLIDEHRSLDAMGE